MEEPPDSRFVPCQPPLRPIRRPGRQIPSDSCDTHVHVVGPPERYLLDPDRGYTPCPCSLAEYWYVMKVLGLGRAVLVQPSVYGFDNAAMLDALREGHPDLRGVAVVRPEIEQKELDTLHEGGVRGARINAVDRAGASIGDALPLAAKIAALGWHLQLFLSPSMLHHIEYIMVDVKTPIVLDHFGNIRPEENGFSRNFEAVRRLLGSGRCWVKLSAPYRLLSGDRAEDDHRMLVEGLVAENPERLLWASDWPHTNVPGEMPDDVALLEDFLALVPDKSVQHRILVENPHKLYWNS